MSIRAHWVLGSFATFALVASCNSVLDNSAGVLESSDGGVGIDAPAPDASAVPTGSSDASDAATSPPVSIDSGGSSPSAPTSDDAGTGTVPTCGLGEKLCSGACVAVDDPLFGCGPKVCTACALAHATAACGAAGCAIASCDPGYADCDQQAADGCETDLSKAAHCGACNAKCDSTAPDCSPTSSGFACTTGCGSDAPTLCGTQCVNLSTSLDDCGACNDACPSVTNGVASCTGAACRFTCDSSFHACGSACASNMSTATCGAACVPCPTGANAVATCDGTRCGIACDDGYANCDGNPADGCEVDLRTDGSNCGKCGVSCGEGSCVNGACTAPPPPDAGTTAPDSSAPPPADAGTPPPDSSAPPVDAAVPPADASGPPPSDASSSG